MADPTPVPSLTLDEALALMDKHADDSKAAQDAEKVKIKKKEKVKDLLKEGAKQGLKGLGIHTKRLLDEVED